MADGQEVEAEESEEDEEGAEGAGNDGAGDVELEVDEEASNHEQEDIKVGVGAPQFGPRRAFYTGISKSF